MSDSFSATGAQTVSRAIGILKFIAHHSGTGMRLADIAEGMQLKRPTAHRLLNALIQEGVLTRVPDSRRYTLGPLIFELGLAAAHQFNLHEICEPILQNLAQQTGDTAFIFLRSGNDAVCIGRVQGTYPIQTPVVPIGSRQPLGVSAGGLALLSCLSEAEVKKILDDIGPRLSIYGNLDVQETQRHWAKARAVGYAWISNRAVPGVSAVGLPIKNASGTPIAAITVATTQARMTEARVLDMLPLLKISASQVAASLGQ